MSLFKINKKILAGLMIITLLLSGTFIPNVKKVEAVPVEVTVDPYVVAGFAKLTAIFTGVLPGQQQDSKKAGVLMSAARMIIRQFTLSVVNWINSGFKGNPSFVTNTEQFLLNTADITVGDFLMNEPALDFLCDPFKIQVKLAIGLQYRPFKQQIECSFTEAVANVNDAMNKFTNGDFIGGGGWDSWLKMTTVPQNNQLGATMLAQAELDARIADAVTARNKELDWGNGFMSWKDCPEVETETNDPTEAEINAVLEEDARFDRYAAVNSQKRGNNGCVIITPGGVIASKMNWFESSTLRQLELANDFNEIIYALANQVILKGMGALSEGGLLGGKKPTPDESYNNYMAYLSGLDAQVNSSDNSGYYNSDGSINFAQSYANRASALETINSQITIENQYFANQSNIFSLLDATQNIFTNSSCTGKTDIINQITGDYTGVKELTWNKSDVTRVSAITTTNLATLSSTASAVQNATNDSAIPNIVQPLTTMTGLHSSATANSYSASGTGGTFYNQIKTWVQGKITANTACVGDTSALNAWLGQ